MITAIGPKQYPYVNEITPYEPPNHVAWKAISSAGWVIGRQAELEQRLRRMLHQQGTVPRTG